MQLPPSCTQLVQISGKGAFGTLFCQSFIDTCLYIDILLKSLSESYLLKDEGTVADYLWVRIIKDSPYCFPARFESILADLIC
jgi:hypothetical protein